MDLKYTKSKRKKNSANRNRKEQKCLVLKKKAK